MATSKKGPPDGGYGWVVVIATAIAALLVYGFVVRVTGFTLVAIIEKYDSTRADTSVIFMTCRIVTCIATPVASKLTTKYSYSSLLIAGGVILFLSSLASAFTTRIWQLVITYGIFFGIGSALGLIPGFLAVTRYFEKRRPLAISAYFSLAGVEGLIIPYIYEFFLSEYHLGGTFLLCAALVLHIVPCGLLIRQPDWPISENPKSELPSKDRNEEINGDVTRDTMSDNLIPPKDPLFQRILANLRKDVTIFKDPVFLVLWISKILVTSSLLNALQFIPDFLKDSNLDISSKNIALLFTVISIGDFSARIITGFVITRLPWHMKYTFAALSVVIGVLIFALLLVKSFVLFLVLHLIYGLAMGMSVVTFYVLEVDLMGLERIPVAHGIMEGTGGIASVIAMYLIAYFRDTSGSYRIGFWIMAVCSVISGLIWLLLPCCPCRGEPQISTETSQVTQVRLNSV